MRRSFSRIIRFISWIFLILHKYIGINTIPVMEYCYMHHVFCLMCCEVIEYFYMSSSEV